ncbi:hypothetical protein [Allocoleopsis sp.]|uniref:hypothetical protein n=1 Tax=Allocoleopsis sp. TaxID=3088169 RepID=UPI002FD2D57E
MTRRMRELVQVQGGFKPSVQLPGDFFDESLNRHFVESYIPTQETLDIFMGVRDSLQPNSEQRARSFVGTYGTGKSDLMLMIANYVTRSPDDPLLAPFFERLRHLNHAKAEAIYKARLGKPPFLLVLLQADTAVTFSSFVLQGLAESLEDKGLEDLLGNTYYQAALNQIEEWERGYPDTIKRLSEVLENDYGRTLNQLKHDLKSSRGDSALEMFRPAAQKASGTPFQPTAVIQRPSEAFAGVAKNVVANGQYSGIFVIADEFTQLLQKLGESPTAADSKGIDNLAEAAVRSGQNQLHFYVVSLQSFASAQGSTQVAQAALERSGGRFSQYELRSQNTEELIGASIVKLISPDHLFDNAERQRDDLLTLAMRLWGSRATGKINREWVQEKVVQGCFPLHPLATYCLPRLNAVLAQNERTMFRFIWDEDRGLNRFISEASGEASDGWISLLSLDKLFGYFESTLEEKRPDLLQAYQEASQTLSPQQIENGIEGRLLRALVMLDVASGDASLRADRDLLRHVLGLASSKMSEVADALNQLEQAGIAYPSQSGHYQLVKQGRANPLELRRLIERRAQELPGSPVELLNADVQYKPDDVDAQKYNSQRSTARHLTARLVSPAGLSSPVALTQALQGKDGLLWYVIAASEQELVQARSTASQLTAQHDQLVVAVPSKPTDLIMRFQRKRALEDLRGSQNYQTPDYQDLLIDTGLVGKDYTTAFEQALRLFEQPSNFEWFHKGCTVTVNTPAHLSLLATKVMNEVFSTTPAHRTRQHLKPSGKLKENLLNKLLQAPFTLPVKRGKTAEEAVLLDGARELGLINQVDQEKGFAIYEVYPPPSQQKHSNAIWLLLDKQLRQGVSWSEVLDTLQRRPYGLYSSVLQLFAAAFYRFNQDYLEVYIATAAGDRPIDVTGKQIIDMVESPRRFVVRYQPLTDTQRKFLRGLAERALYPGREFRIQTGETASLRNRVAKLLRLWTNEISIVAQQASDDELASVLQSVSSETISASVALMETACQPSEPETAAALLEYLPIRLGLPDDSSQWTDTELDKTLAYLENACQQLRQFMKKFKERMAWQIGQCFGLTEPPNDWNDALNAARKWRTQSVGALRSTHLGGNPDARDLLYVLDDASYKFERAFLNELAEQWKLLPFDQWQTIRVQDEYLQRLRQAKADAEAKVAELGLSSPQTTATGAATATTAPITATKSSVAATKSSTTARTAPVATKSSATVKKTSASATKNSATATTNSVSGESNCSSASPQTAEGIIVKEPDKSADTISAVDQAFTQVKAIFEGLSPPDRYALWERLREEYDPR